MTKQEFIDLLQKACDDGVLPSVDEEGNKACKYRGENGTRCAVGLLIPDSEYRDEFEGYGCTESGFERRYTLKRPDGVSERQLREIQISHDMGEEFCPQKFMAKVKEILA